MTPAALKQVIASLQVWKKGDVRAPNKPLLILLALARVQSGGSRLVPYAEVEGSLRALLTDFGPRRRSVHPEYPFWFLQTDGIWEVPDGESLKARKANVNPPRLELLRHGARGGFTAPVFDLLSSNPALVSEIGQLILDQSFPSTLHEDIATAVGLNLEPVRRGKRRDPDFRRHVLAAYGHRCCVCGHFLLLGNQHVGIEAAHIKWVAAGGPDVTGNGLALCSLHHKLFDLGCFTLEPTSLSLVLSKDLCGVGEALEGLHRLHGKTIAEPRDATDTPSSAFITWHRKEVFRGPGLAL